MKVFKLIWREIMLNKWDIIVVALIVWWII
jgi:hypothetical protein